MLRAIHELISSCEQIFKSQYLKTNTPTGIRGTPKPVLGRLYGECAAANSRQGEEQNLGTAKFSLGHWGLKCGHHLFAAGEQTGAGPGPGHYRYPCRRPVPWCSNSAGRRRLSCRTPWHAKRASRSESRTSSGHRSAPIATE